MAKGGEWDDDDRLEYINYLDNNTFMPRNWDTVFTEKEVEESFVYSKDMYTSMEWRVSQEVIDFEKILRIHYDEWLRNHASVYQLNSKDRRQCSDVTSWVNEEEDVYVELVENYKWMSFCMIVGYEFPKRSIRKGIIKVKDYGGWKFPTWVNKRGKVLVEKVDFSSDSDYQAFAYNRKDGMRDENELETIVAEFEEKTWEIEDYGWKNIGSRIDVEENTEMEIEVIKLKDAEY